MTFGAFLSLGHLKLGSGGRGSRLHTVTLMGRRIFVYVPLLGILVMILCSSVLIPDGPQDGLAPIRNSVAILAQACTLCSRSRWS